MTRALSNKKLRRAQRLMTLRNAAGRRVDQMAQRADGMEMEVFASVYGYPLWREGRRVIRARDALRHLLDTRPT